MLTSGTSASGDTALEIGRSVRRPWGPVRLGLLASCAALLAAIAAGVSLETAGGRSGRPATRAVQRHRRPAHAGLFTLPARAQGAVSAALGSGSSAYRVAATRAGFRASNPAQRLQLSFAPGGVQISSEGLQLGLRLSAAGYGSALRNVPAATPAARANGVLYAHPGLSEWYFNGPLGLQQGFSIPRRLSTVVSGPLTLSLALSGNSHATLTGNGHSLTLTDAGRAVLRYTSLLATDARGRALRSWMELHSGRLLLRIDTTGARYPLRIDPLVQQGEKLTGGGEAGSGEFGYAVAMSSNGSAALVGGPADNAGAGAAWAFKRSGSTWTQVGGKLTPKSGEEVGTGRFGASVALSSQGREALVGAPADNGKVGAAWVFTLSEGKWIQQGEKLTPKSGEETGAGAFGTSVALSGEKLGETAVIGAPANDGNVGAVWVFSRAKKTGVWAQSGEKLVPKSGEELGSGSFGESVALVNGSALVGAPGDHGEAGAAWAFTLTGGKKGVVLVQDGSKLTGEGEGGTGQFGESVALSGEATTALIGGPGDNSGAGAAWVFALSEGKWTGQGEKLTPKSAEETGAGRFGDAEALSSNGDTALIGANQDNAGTGAAWEFTRSGSTWSQESEKLTGGAESGAGQFGSAVAFSSSATRALIGGSEDDAGAGAVWAFIVPPGPVPANVKPPTILGGEQQGDTLVLGHGSWTNSPTGFLDQWLRCNATGEECEAVPGETDQSYALSAADVGHTLRVEEVAYNRAGESEPQDSEASSVITALALMANPGENLRACSGVEVSFDGTGSTPASQISDYQWEFGDSTGAEGATVEHAYSSPGTYTATLTVQRNTEHQSASIKVEVIGCGGVGAGPDKVLIHVQNASKAPITGAEVLYVAPHGTRIDSLTESAGEAVLSGLPEGIASVYVYKSGSAYRAREARVEVNAKGEGEATVTLEEGEIVATGVHSHEMDLEEIEAAGINPDEPANKEVFKFEVKLGFGGSGHGATFECYVNAAGEFVGQCEGGGGKTVGGGEEGWACSATGCETGAGEGGGIPGTEGGGGEGGVVRIEPVPPPVGPKPCQECEPEPVPPAPAVQWLILRGKATMLKQFLEVSMGVVNLSPEAPFELTRNEATLNLPAGLSLAPTPTPQSLTQSLPDIKPLGSASANWIIRGDQPGEYFLSADYAGTLEPFEAAIGSHAALQKAFRVWGSEALKLKVRADAGKYIRATPYHVTLGIEDVANIPLYNVELAIEEDVHEHFIFQPRQQFSEALGELIPKRPVYIARPYILVPEETSLGTFNPGISSATFVGETIHPGEGIEELPPPPLYELEARTTTPSFVHLRWKKTAGSGYGTPEGFEVYSTPNLQSPFGSKPVLVRETPTSPPVEELSAGASEAYVPAKAGETLEYAVSTVVEAGHFKLEMPLVEGEAQTPPEFGRCVKVETGKGKYSSSKCTTSGGKDDYEWTSEASKTGVTLSASSVKLETVAKAAIACKALSGKGAHAHGKGLEGVLLTLTGCELERKACSSSGAGAGEVRSNTLSGELVWEKKASGKVALDLSRPGGGAIMGFECAGKKVEVKGSVLAAVKTDKMAATVSLKYKATKGAQKPSEYETSEGAKETDVLETSIAGASFERAGLTSTVTLTSEESLEVDPAV